MILAALLSMVLAASATVVAIWLYAWSAHIMWRSPLSPLDLWYLALAALSGGYRYAIPGIVIGVLTSALFRRGRRQLGTWVVVAGSCIGGAIVGYLYSQNAPHVLGILAVTSGALSWSVVGLLGWRIGLQRLSAQRPP
jgi:ABC-type spermidine/putrescine transport system permease subunit II